MQRHCKTTPTVKVIRPLACSIWASTFSRKQRNHLGKANANKLLLGFLIACEDQSSSLQEGIFCRIGGQRARPIVINVDSQADFQSVLKMHNELEWFTVSCSRLLLVPVKGSFRDNLLRLEFLSPSKEGAKNVAQ